MRLIIHRSTAPNSLTLWVHNIKGLTVHKSSFKPRGCQNPINQAAISFGAGIQMGELNQVANASGLTILSGGQHGVSYGGFGSGGGHSALGATFGMAADNIVEMEIVSPGGDVLTINECQNQDLFWAMRGVSKRPLHRTTYNLLCIGRRLNLWRHHFYNNRCMALLSLAWLQRCLWYPTRHGALLGLNVLPPLSISRTCGIWCDGLWRSGTQR